MPRFSSTVPTPYHPPPICTFCPESILPGPEICSFILCPQRTRQTVLIAFSRTLILLLCFSGDVEINPGPACPQALSFLDFCNHKGLGFMQVNIRSLLPKFVLLTALAHSANPDVLAVSESWLRKATKILTFPSPTTTFSDKIELPKGAELQSTAEIP